VLAEASDAGQDGISRLGPDERLRLGVGALPAPAVCVADAAYNSDSLRSFLAERGTRPVIPNKPTRKRPHPFDRGLYRRRTCIERLICRLKDWRRVATRYDKLARNYLAAVHLAAIVTCWL
jgi:putative transposase